LEKQLQQKIKRRQGAKAKLMRKTTLKNDDESSVEQEKKLEINGKSTNESSEKQQVNNTDNNQPDNNEQDTNLQESVEAINSVVTSNETDQSSIDEQTEMNDQFDEGFQDDANEWTMVTAQEPEHNSTLDLELSKNPDPKVQSRFSFISKTFKRRNAVVAKTIGMIRSKSFSIGKERPESTKVTTVTEEEG